MMDSFPLYSAVPSHNYDATLAYMHVEVTL